MVVFSGEKRGHSKDHIVQGHVTSTEQLFDLELGHDEYFHMNISALKGIFWK